ncbi:MAG: hypothetical protein JSR47_06250 [Proteobacteria bacterium]|nr:hypothetical protein [Pseudomonadota bacterium]MBS0550202.1 hypothetical protein [Pseudomonadota bacterium]
MALALPFCTTGCVPSIKCVAFSPIDEAASYDWLIADRRYSEPLNTWVRNDGLERFLRRAIAYGGVDALKSQYGFDCVSKEAATCPDCYVCRASIAKQVAEQEGRHSCIAKGRMLIQVDLGRGRLSAMTNWERPPLAPDAGKF